MLSTDRVLAPGRIAGLGSESDYLALTEHPAEERFVRSELGDGRMRGQSRSLLHVAQLTDLHSIDVASPGRFEFAERLYDIEELRSLLPAHRPQEFLTVQALDAVIRAVNQVERSPVTDAPLDCVLLTGDLVDNAQCNELSRFEALISGGTVQTATKDTYEGVAAGEWSDPAYWHPDGAIDDYKRRWGFPTFPGLLKEAARPFQAEGLRHPWVACRGNHDALVNGTAVPNQEYQRLIKGGQKASLLAPDLFPSAFSDVFEQFLLSPETFLRGSPMPVTPDPRRRIIDSAAFWESITGGARSLLRRDGFSRQSVPGTATFVYDGFESVRVIVLDTVNVAGHWEGSIGAQQHAWLRERLIEVHSAFFDENGKQRSHSGRDRIVVIVMHHPLHTLTNLRSSNGAAGRDPRDEPRLGVGEVRDLLHRFPNVVLVINGHTHINRITAHADPRKRTAGFWEVTTGSLVDWPCEGRLIELVANSDASLSIFTTMLSSSSPADSSTAGGLDRLAALHRELAANDPHAGWRSGYAGTRYDRTTDLRIPSPFKVKGI